MECCFMMISFEKWFWHGSNLIIMSHFTLECGKTLKNSIKSFDHHLTHRNNTARSLLNRAGIYEAQGKHIFFEFSCNDWIFQWFQEWTSRFEIQEWCVNVNTIMSLSIFLIHEKLEPNWGKFGHSKKCKWRPASCRFVYLQIRDKSWYKSCCATKWKFYKEIFGR